MSSGPERLSILIILARKISIAAVFLFFISGCVFWGLVDNMLLSSLEGRFGFDSFLVPAGEGLIIVNRPESPLWGPKTGFSLVDVSNPLTPSVLAAHVADGEITSLVYKNGFVYYKTDSINVIDITDPRRPQKIAELSIPENQEFFSIYENHILYNQDIAINISDPTAPVAGPVPAFLSDEVVLLSAIAGSKEEWQSYLAVEGAAYVGEADGFYVLDLSFPTSPSQGVSIAGFTPFAIYDSILYTGSGSPFKPAVKLFDISDPLHPNPMYSPGNIPVYMGLMDLYCDENFMYALSQESFSISVRPGRDSAP